MKPDHLKAGAVLDETWEILQGWQLGLLLTYLATKFMKYKMNHTFGKSYEINQVLGEKI